MKTGGLHIMDVYQSAFTRQLIITVSCAVTDQNDNIVGVIGADIQLEALLRKAEALKDDVAADDTGEE